MAPERSCIVLEDGPCYIFHQIIFAWPDVRSYGLNGGKTSERICNQTPPSPHLAKSFHDHVIRTQIDYETIWLYIDSNPQTWQTDCLNPNRNNPQQSDTRKDVTL